jgi:hypothetical protein
MKKIKKTDLLSLLKAKRRKESMAQGFYDGRFKGKVIESAKHKKPKHRNRNNED